MGKPILQFAPGAFFDEFLALANGRPEPLTFACDEGMRNERYAALYTNQAKNRLAAVYEFWADEWLVVGNHLVREVIAE